MNWKKLIYWIPTLLMALIFIGSATMYLTKFEMVKGFYQQLGFPVWMIIPSAILKYLALIIISFDLHKVLKEYAYAGLMIDAAFGFAAHSMINDGQGMLALFALIFTFLSRIFYNYRNIF